VLINKNQLKQLILENIPPFYEEEEKETLIKIFACELLNVKPTKYLLCDEYELSEIQINKLKASLEFLNQGNPLQYIFGNAFFYGRDFKVTPDVLIPRPETEELCKWIIEDTNQISPKILDIGCGSGNIAITLDLELKNAAVFAIDISKNALLVAKENATQNNSNVVFEQMDILNWENSNKFSSHKFDVIVSNPPYILEEEKIMMRKNVLDFEPHLALFVKNNPLLFYQTIAQFSIKHLAINGKLFFELNEAYFNECKILLEKLNFKNIQLKKDMAGKYRMISCVLFEPNF
jgi:release factor glutamine methyltransferase